MDMVTSATPFAGIDWFIVSIFAPDSVKIETNLNLTLEKRRNKHGKERRKI